MNRHATPLYMVLAFALALTTGCKKGWIDINYDPRQITDETATPDLILPPILYQMATGSGITYMQWMGYWSYPRNTAGSAILTYNIQDANQFPGVGGNLDIFRLENNAVLHNQPFYQGIAKVLKAVDYAGAVDVYNNLPYREANDVNIRTPHYDNGQFIYEDLMVQLDSAHNQIQRAASDKALHISTADLLFQGDKTKWYRFINTVKLRLLVHQANKPGREAYIKAQIDNIVKEGSGFLPSGGDASINPGFTQEKPSPYFAQFSMYDQFVRYYNGDLSPLWTAASANVTAMNMLKENHDPRLSFFYSPALQPVPDNAQLPFDQPGPKEYRGNKFGLVFDPVQMPYQDVNYVSQIGSSVRSKGVAVSATSTGLVKGYNMNIWIMTSIESAFLVAEAVQRGWIAGDPETAYKNAVKESFRWLNVGGNTTIPQLSDDAFNNWYTAEAGNPNVNWSAAPDKYKLIMYQKYTAFNGIAPFEAYVDYRRNGLYPNIPVSYSPDRISDKMPIRSPYPSTEYVQNPEAVKAQGDINIFTSKIWWMP